MATSGISSFVLDFSLRLFQCLRLLGNIVTSATYSDTSEEGKLDAFSQGCYVVKTALIGCGHWFSFNIML